MSINQRSSSCPVLHLRTLNLSSLFKASEVIWPEAVGSSRIWAESSLCDIFILTPDSVTSPETERILSQTPSTASNFSRGPLRFCKMFYSIKLHFCHGAALLWWRVVGSCIHIFQLFWSPNTTSDSAKFVQFPSADFRTVRFFLLLLVTLGEWKQSGTGCLIEQISGIHCKW